MDRVLILIILIVLMLTILAFAFNWVNENFNYYIDENAEFEREITGLKEMISREILKWQRENNLTIVQAQEKLGVNSQLLRDITNATLEEISIDTLTSLLYKTGKEVRISVGT